MRKRTLVITAMTAVLCLAGCSSKTTTVAQETTTAAQTETAAETTAEAESIETDVEAESESVIGMPNPWSDHAKLADAETAAGFEIELPEEISGTTANVFRTLDGEDATLEVIYNDGKGEEQARIRKAPGSEDISGDYNDYSESKEVEIDGKTVTLKGNDGKIMLAVWQDGDYSYSVTTTVDGISEDDMTAVVKAVK